MNTDHLTILLKQKHNDTVHTSYSLPPPGKVCPRSANCPTEEGGGSGRCSGRGELKTQLVNENQTSPSGSGGWEESGGSQEQQESREGGAMFEDLANDTLRMTDRDPTRDGDSGGADKPEEPRATLLALETEVEPRR